MAASAWALREGFHHHHLPHPHSDSEGDSETDLRGRTMTLSLSSCAATFPRVLNLMEAQDPRSGSGVAWVEAERVEVVEALAPHCCWNCLEFDANFCCHRETTSVCCRCICSSRSSSQCWTQNHHRASFHNAPGWALVLTSRLVREATGTSLHWQLHWNSSAIFQPPNWMSSYLHPLLGLRKSPFQTWEG